MRNVKHNTDAGGTVQRLENVPAAAIFPSIINIINMVTLLLLTVSQDILTPSRRGQALSGPLPPPHAGHWEGGVLPGACPQWSAAVSQVSTVQAMGLFHQVSDCIHQNATQVNKYFLVQDTVLGAEVNKTDKKPCPVALRK